MSLELVAVVVAGGFGVVGTVVGALMSTWLGRAADQRRLAAEDERRWQADRRHVYAAFLTMSESMLREIDGTAVLLSYDGKEQVSEEDEEYLADGMHDYIRRWDDELQPALGDVQLLASGRVADLADRVSGALLEVTTVVELRGAFTDYYPIWFRARDLLGVLRNAMRSELGLAEGIEGPVPEDADWPWLEDRPTEEEYIQRQAEIPGRPPLTPGEVARLEARDRA